MSGAVISLPAEHADIIFDALVDSRGFVRQMSAMPGADMHYWGAQTQRIDAAYTSLVIAKMGMKTPTLEIGDELGGGLYAGTVTGADGCPAQRLVLLPGEAADVDWDAAHAFATSVGGELPTRAEQALLFANLKEQFQPRWYWSCEQAGPSLAWYQNFNYGTQYYLNRSDEGRARAVRRLPI